MAEQRAKATTSGMVGHGFYDRHSEPQMAANAHVLPWLDDAMAELDLSGPPETLALADFGCSEGRNSVAVMQRAVATLRQRTDQPIQTIHSDLPSNDYSELFARLRPDGRSVFDPADVYSAAVGGSMFDQLLPPRSLRLATSFNAIGFLSRRPLALLPGYILPHGPSKVCGIGEVTDEEHAAFAAQARDDVESFLKARAAELLPGGKLLLQVFGADREHSTSDGIYDAYNQALLEVRDAGMISAEAYADFYQPVYLRRLDELTAPVKDDGAALAGLYKLERTESYETPTAFAESFKRDGDAAAYARDMTDFFRAFTEPVLRLAFADHGDLELLVDDVYARAERAIRDNPERYPFHYVSVAMLLTRRDA